MRLIRRLAILILVVVVLDAVGVVEIRRDRVEALAAEAKEFLTAQIAQVIGRARDSLAARAPAAWSP